MKLFKAFRAALLVLSLGLGLGAAAQAATLVNQGDPLEITLGKKSIDGTSYTFDYLNGGLVTFLFVDDNPNDGKSTISLKESGGGYLFQNKVFNLGQAFSLALGAGTYVVQLMTPARGDTFEISAVPLPGAALLFGSALLGFLGFTNRRKV